MRKTLYVVASDKDAKPCIRSRATTPKREPDCERNATGLDTPTYAEPAVAAWALALIGLFNIVGSYGSGLLGARHSKR
jgi:hypothetical protein